VSKRSGFYPCPAADAAGQQVVSQAGGLLLTETVRVVGLDRELSAALGRWRAPTAVHDPAKVINDLALMLGLGGDCLADIALLRAEPGVYGLVASDPTVSRTVDRLAEAPVAALRASISRGDRPGAGVGAGPTPSVAVGHSARRCFASRTASRRGRASSRPLFPDPAGWNGPAHT
jgi:hypothetical protein